jgi:DNA-binding response OmpR family regulator
VQFLDWRDLMAKILLLEDDFILSESLKEILENENFSVI